METAVLLFGRRGSQEAQGERQRYLESAMIWRLEELSRVGSGGVDNIKVQGLQVPLVDDLLLAEKVHVIKCRYRDCGSLHRRELAE